MTDRTDRVDRVDLNAIVQLLLTHGVAVETVGDVDDVAVTTITHDSRQVTPGTLFACVGGDHVDGHDFAQAAVDAGAVALLVERRLSAPGLADVAQLVVDDTRRRLGPVSALIAGNPSAALTTVGITGTNGKTTVSSMIATIFEANRWSTGIIGTLHGPRTTPEAPELQRALAGFVEGGRAAAVLEVSSHALALHRIDGTRFDAVVFTNLGHDHLDLHGTPEEYFRAKASLFTSDFAPIALINADDVHGRLLIDVLAGSETGMTVVPFSTSTLVDVHVTATTISFGWRGHSVDVAIGGQFNVSNSLAALETAVALGIDPAVAAGALGALAPIPGRFEIVPLADGTPPPFSVVVDYAHTPDGIIEVLAAARSAVADDAAVIIVFGCGGDRDQAKRPAMGAAAAAGADRLFITSDNPRTEDPLTIINDIIEGVADRYRERATAQPDRRLAIGAALEAARPGDIVVIAGKGHETTQDLGASVVAFDDRDVARSFLNAPPAAPTAAESTELP